MSGNVEKYWRIGFWGFVVLLLAVCSYFMISNAWWIIGDEEIIVSHVGRGIPFSPKGFPVAPLQGRLYPFAYNLYNVMLLFNGSYNTPQSVYILHSVALSIYAVFFALIGLHILKNMQALWKYSITFCVVAIAVFRVFREFTTCYTGVWIILMFLPIFLYCVIRFDETEHWGWGVTALLVINYITYCYENVCIIPFAMGTCSLLFNWKALSNRQRMFNGLLIAGCVVFLCIWVFAILPQATEFYEHQVEESPLSNGIRIFIAQKIYWLAAVAFVVRFVQVISQKSAYCVYDSMLLAALSYFVGSAILKLNYTYYYNVGVLVALVAILYYVKEMLSERWGLAIFVILALFYGRSIPLVIKENQVERVASRQAFEYLSEMSKSTDLYWYAPEYENEVAYYVSLRDCQRIRVEAFIHWIQNNDEVRLKEEETFDSSLKGIWLFPEENEKLFPNYLLPDDCIDKVVDVRGIKGYIIK